MPIPNQLERTANVGYSFLCLPVDLASITAAGDVVTTVTPGFPGWVQKWFWVTNVAVSTGGKLATLNLEVNAVDIKMPDGVTNSTISLTSAAVTPIGKVIAGTAVGQGWAKFDKDDTISVEASSVTAFVEGSGTVVLVVGYRILK